MIFFCLMRFSEKQEMSEELKNIAKAMDDYHSNLSAIENIIKHWDPLEKAIFRTIPLYIVSSWIISRN